MPGWVEEHPDVLLWLGRGHRRSQSDRVGDRGIEVADLEVEVHHRALFPVDWRPDRGSIAGCLLEHQIDGSLRSGDNGRPGDCRMGSEVSMDVRFCRDRGALAGRAAVTVRAAARALCWY